MAFHPWLDLRFLEMTWESRARIWGSRAKIWGSRARIWGSMAKIWGFRARIWGSTARIWCSIQKLIKTICFHWTTKAHRAQIAKTIGYYLFFLKTCFKNIRFSLTKRPRIARKWQKTIVCYVCFEKCFKRNLFLKWGRIARRWQKQCVFIGCFENATNISRFFMKSGVAHLPSAV